jgi:prepilin-type N-terminal cleavage/methylation domain-containing protein
MLSIVSGDKMFNKKGVTLVEVMIALTILLLVFLALMQTALVSIDSNMRNALRDEAVRIVERQFEQARNMDFNNLPSFATAATALPAVNIRNAPITYTITRTVDMVDIRDLKQRTLSISVSWTWKGEIFTHNAAIIIGREVR